MPARQQGWAGVLALLFAVLIVALLAGAVLKQARPPADHAEPDPGGATGVAGGAAQVEAEGAAPAPGSALERARALEQSVQQQASDLDKRMRDAEK